MFFTTARRAAGIFCHLGASFWIHTTAIRSDIQTNQELTPDADIVNVRFTKSVIASKAAFTYEEAQIRKDDPYVISVTKILRLVTTCYW